MAIPAASLILVGVAEILTVAVLLSRILMLAVLSAGTVVTLTRELFVDNRLAITVSVPSTRASVLTGMVMVAEV
ncbi:hypothetical protein D3C87_715910 [compost metagenome]